SRWSSHLGTAVFMKCFFPNGITTSLIRGIPKRDTCVKGPVTTASDRLSPDWSPSPSVGRIVAARLLADAHIPIVEFLPNGSVGFDPFDVSLFCAICISLFL